MTLNELISKLQMIREDFGGNLTVLDSVGFPVFGVIAVKPFNYFNDASDWDFYEEEVVVIKSEN